MDSAFSASSASVIHSSRLTSTMLARNEANARSMIFSTMPEKRNPTIISLSRIQSRHLLTMLRANLSTDLPHFGLGVIASCNFVLLIGHDFANSHEMRLSKALLYLALDETRCLLPVII